MSCPSEATEAESDIGPCECSSESLDLKLLFALSHECDWSDGLRGFLYLILLAWCFLGVAIISNIFMEAVERITAEEKTRVVGGKTEKVLVWNPTVANLTLLALGSSAPEILLSVIEILLGGFKAGALGPGTIVGSAAFNLFVIIAICISSIPAGQTRRIKQFGVFVWTALVSVLAYLWLLVIIVGSTPNYVTVPEALITLLFFPALVYFAFAIDTQQYEKWGCRSRINPQQQGQRIVSKTKGTLNRIFHRQNNDKVFALEPREALKVVQALQVGKEHLTEEQLQEIGAALAPRSRAQRRAMALGIDRRAAHKAAKAGKSADAVLRLRMTLQSEPFMQLAAAAEETSLNMVRFEHLSYAVKEDVGTVHVSVVREGDTSEALYVGYKSRDGCGKDPATAGEDYEPVSGVLIFQQGEQRKTISVKIIDDEVPEANETFELSLTMPSFEKGMVSETYNWQEGRRCNVLIIDNDGPGQFTWSKKDVYVDEEANEARLQINRENGAHGTVSVSVQTCSGTALPHKDYVENQTTLTFEHGVSSVEVVIERPEALKQASPQMQKDGSPVDLSFTVQLKDATNGSTINKELETVVVHLNESEEQRKYMHQVATIINATLEAETAPDASTYLEQLRNAMSPNGGSDSPPTAIDWVWHVISIFWKVLFATTPPPSWNGGWPCFCVALAWVGAVTLVISEAATVVGCVMGLTPACTAVTIVALGTSLPDMFASKAAAVSDPTADASITNVTGSNCVNVFLGLGLPWLMASVYWTSQGCDGLYVPGADSLYVNVATFVGLACLCITGLALRRRYLGGELGGPEPAKTGFSVLFVLFWIIYITFGCCFASTPP